MSSSVPPGGPPQGESRHGDPPRPAVSSDELLPPIEPPTAGFIIQLFVVPAVIVACVVGVWFLIESLARQGEQDPDQIVAALRSSNQARFQQAKELADMLRLPERYPELKTNRELAQKLAVYLEELVAEGDDGDASVAMRYFLASALGEFSVPDGFPALIKTAEDDPERDVRRKAINAIAVLSGSVSQAQQRQQLGRRPLRDTQAETLSTALLSLANDQDELIRSETAFALGVVAAKTQDAQLISALEELADDPYTDARFNAAIGLAGLEHPQAAAAIAEMVDPESLASSVSGEKALTEQVTKEALDARKAYKRNAIVTSALKAIDRLLESKTLPPESFAPLDAALSKFIAAAPGMTDPAPVPAELLKAVKRTHQRVQSRAAAAK